MKVQLQFIDTTTGKDMCITFNNVFDSREYSERYWDTMSNVRYVDESDIGFIS